MDNATIRRAILLAADHIERHPREYNFDQTVVPDCGSPGCLWGWIGHFLGMQGATNLGVAKAIGIQTTSELYEFCSARACDYRDDAALAAACLRQFADVRFPAQSASAQTEDSGDVNWC